VLRLRAGSSARRKYRGEEHRRIDLTPRVLADGGAVREFYHTIAQLVS
jgi:hypothetical protein